MLMVSAWVGKSEIHGLGLIAQEFIPEGTIIWKFIPGFDVMLSQEEFGCLSEVSQKQVVHYGFYDDNTCNYVLSADDDRFTNHSDNANSKYCGEYAVASRNIYPGEEITDNYNEFGKRYCKETRPNWAVKL